MTKTVPRVYIFHFQSGKTETLIGSSAADALSRAGHGRGALAIVDYYEAPADET